MASLYLTDALGDPRPGARVEVTGDEARHALQVARIRPGERIAVGDGRGTVVRGAVVEAAPGVLAVEVDEVAHEPEPSPQLWLAQALAKGDRDELAIQAATELGVAGVIPWAAERSVTRWEGAKVARNEERWRTIVREASKQAIRARVPEVASLTTTAQLAGRPGLVVVLEPTADVPLSALALDDVARITLVVGPEGGVAPRELARLADAGAVLARLGAEVLRTSTAGPAALAVLNARLGRW
ncbi:16S rRNA (uracil(1498)-N(3))-methyltransferase [Protaetiibacter mangrovi]|uniref:Ribosomal RNA small subunit methyltransferase E n=1 Tax=Protaetiibacter mangrovi TaxID=2970926 RepID=A0ABT1ZEX5_9MICO|nr:16S rRNA (uracil(1498)-N(3))-methyltransferase [Protaetiibacter mangrovi]MCS0499253.1 16S rRNA (uracil(1498)-N(3))-methyltransferase [Protaetiibacter mangrovi]TPX04533.1 16S rRNA (uracil(1498)-N(3))-methyltransferase [Schumannella luteola]